MSSSSGPSPTLQNLNARDQLRGGRLPRRIGQLLIGLIGYGAAVMMLVQSGLGAAAWNVLTEGIAHQTGLSFGTTTNLIAVVVLIAWIPMHEWPGLGTVLNVCLVGPAADLTAIVVPPAESLGSQVTYLLIGTVLLAFFDAVYLGAQLGAGPRDGIMTGLTRITKQPVRRVRTGIEVIVATIGWVLGGTLGFGTVVVALAMGPLLGVFLPRTIIRVAPPRSEATVAGEAPFSEPGPSSRTTA